jgi:riboflavin synthase
VFTGIIAGIGRVAAREAVGGDCRFTIDLGTAEFPQPKIGDSIAVNGVCLTATAVAGRQFSADVSVETLAVTTLGGLDAGAPVNIEPALRVGDSLSGHFVSGHVDGIGRLRAAGSAGRSQRLDFDVPTELLRYLARKGSVAVDGVSLTINAVSATGFAVNIVPHTREMTIISAYRTGTAVNIEVDVIARYLERLAGSPQGIDREFLSKHGYSDAEQ